MNFYRYFQSNTGYFWSWEENAEVTASYNGITIAYREFLLQILRNLSTQGVPPYGSLLLAIIATNPNEDYCIKQINQKLNNLLKKEQNKFNDTRAKEILDSAIKFMYILSSLPKQYKEGQLRLYLFQTIFASCHNMLSVQNSKAMLRIFDSKIFDKEQLANPLEAGWELFNKDFAPLSHLFKKFPDGGAIINAIASIPEIDEKVNLPEEASSIEAFENDFVQALIDNPKTFHIGSLIKRIWAGLKIPYNHTLPNELPLGGVSDIANKGDFDKLLISEFANDDLIFLSRLANNEALFLRREMPPISDTTQRIILLDTSIKNWGTPKVLAYAVLMAIAKHPKTTINSLAFAVGNSVTPVLFTTTEEIIHSLAILDSSLHPAKGIEAFFKSYPNPKVLEIFLITSGETMKLPSMQKTLKDYNQFFKYFVVTHKNGSIDFFINHFKSKKLLQSLNINLREAWKQETKTELIQTETAYPILFPKCNINKIMTNSDGVIFIITTERKLFLVSEKNLLDNKKGLEEVWTKLPLGDFDIGIIDNGNTVLFCYSPQLKELIFINLTTKETLKQHFPTKKTNSNSFFFHEGAFHYIGSNSQWTSKYGKAIETVKINPIEAHMKDIHLARENEMNELKGRYHSFFTLPLKRVKNVFINNVDNIVLNIHELIKREEGTYHLQATEFLRRKVVALNTKKNEFTFPDGSCISVNNSGMITLISSNADIAPIFIPTSLDKPLGCATDKYFAGNPYFYPENSDIIKTDSHLFWKNNIEKFISNILLNATAAKTIS